MKLDFLSMFSATGVGIISGTIVSFFSEKGVSALQLILFSLISIILIYIGNKNNKESQ